MGIIGDFTGDVLPRGIGFLLSVGGLLMMSFVEIEEKLVWAAWSRDPKFESHILEKRKLSHWVHL